MKRKVAFILAAILLVSVFVGCGTNDPAPAAPAAPPAAGAAPAAPAAPAEPAGDDVVELVFWHMEEPPHRVARFNSIIDQFNNEHPNIRVTPVVQSWGDAFTMFPAAIMAGTGPDLLLTTPDHATIIHALGAVQPVTEIVNRIHNTHTYIDAATIPYRFTNDYYAIPIYGMIQVLWYRRDKFEAAGISPPTSWPEFLAAAEALTTPGVHGIALPASRSMATDQVIYSLMAAGGAMHMVRGDGTINFNTPETVAAFQLYVDLLEFSPPDSTVFQWGEPHALFNAGLAAMAIEKGQYLLPWQDESGLGPEYLGGVLIPTPTGTGTNYAIYYPNGILLLSDDPAKFEATSTFFYWLFQPEIYGSFVNAEPGLFLPVTETGSRSNAFLTDPIISQFPEQTQLLLEASSLGVLFGFTDGVNMDIGLISGPNLLAATLQQIVVGGMSVADAVAWGQAEMERAIAN